MNGVALNLAANKWLFTWCAWASVWMMRTKPRLSWPGADVLARRPEPFDHPDSISEIKFDHSVRAGAHALIHFVTPSRLIRRHQTYWRIVKCPPQLEPCGEFGQRCIPKAQVMLGKLPRELARLVCQRINCRWDMELRDRYAKWKPSRYWIKVKNPRSSQLEGREELSSARCNRDAPLKKSETQ